MHMIVESNQPHTVRVNGDILIYFTSSSFTKIFSIEKIELNYLAF